mmetsp:Transcript_38088/g.67758  ORF Transcript_38088/g.67758 Transcript_38088/m.67758 type:complete len:212 (+) Transcript_38088:287-922(+)
MLSCRSQWTAMQKLMSGELPYLQPLGFVRLCQPGMFTCTSSGNCVRTRLCFQISRGGKSLPIGPDRLTLPSRSFWTAVFTFRASRFPISTWSRLSWTEHQTAPPLGVLKDALEKLFKSIGRTSGRITYQAQSCGSPSTSLCSLCQHGQEFKCLCLEIFCGWEDSLCSVDRQLDSQAHEYLLNQGRFAFYPTSIHRQSKTETCEGGECELGP